MSKPLVIAGVLACLPFSASAQLVPLSELGGLVPLSPAPAVPLLGTVSPGLSELPALPSAPLALPTETLHAADSESADKDAFKAGNAALQQALDKIKDDAWKGKGPGRYSLPGVTHLYIDAAGGGHPTLYVNSQPMGYLKGVGSHDSASAMKEALRQGGNEARTVVVEGHYANTVFYIDRIRFAD
jgi:hypothetical protein